MTIGQKCVYHGAGSEGVMYGENCRVVELLPHGTYFTGKHVTCNPQPAEFDAHLGRYIGDWMRVESLDDDITFVAPMSWFNTQQQPLGGGKG